MSVTALEGPPEVRIREDGRRILVRDFVVDLEESTTLFPLYRVDKWVISQDSWGDTLIRVPAGFEYDGASIPALAQLVTGEKELYEQAGCVHDALYRWQVPRAAADYVFWLIARSGSKRVGPVRGWLGWAALRLFGALAYGSRG